MKLRDVHEGIDYTFLQSIASIVYVSLASITGLKLDTDHLSIAVAVAIGLGFIWLIKELCECIAKESWAREVKYRRILEEIPDITREEIANSLFQLRQKCVHEEALYLKLNAKDSPELTEKRVRVSNEYIALLEAFDSIFVVDVDSGEDCKSESNDKESIDALQQT